ncbi:MAG: hypothetical protein LBT48_01370 [Prevotellaceae bacterium]|nr:hypothetical protein [Prevotellaceae bacterium]
MKKRERVSPCKKVFSNFNTAKTIGILFPYDTVVGEAVGQLTGFFASRGIEVKTLCYCDSKAMPLNFPASLLPIFCNWEVSWVGRPLSEAALAFMHTPFDICIDFMLNDIHVMQYIAALSEAKMKVGRWAYAGNPYDFVLSLPGGNTDAYSFVEQLNHYMVTIDMKND